MMEMREFTYSSCDGAHQVHTLEWLPGTPVMAVVQLVHGVSEHILRYDGFARYLARNGYAVVGNDHLGHGKTAAGSQEYGFAGETGGWRLMTGDVRALRVEAGKRYPGLPYFILGHSMGSFLARTYLIDWPGTVTGAVLSGTGQESPGLVSFGKWLAGAERLRLGPRGHSGLIDRLSFGSYNKRIPAPRTHADWISRDTAVVDAYVADPLCSFYPTVSMFRDMMDGLQYIADENNLARMDPSTPVYFFSGKEDPVGKYGAGPEKVYRLFLRAGCADLTIKLYPGARHEMLNELNRSEVYSDVLGWLDAHCRPEEMKPVAEYDAVL